MIVQLRIAASSLVVVFTQYVYVVRTNYTEM